MALSIRIGHVHPSSTYADDIALNYAVWESLPSSRCLEFGSLGCGADVALIIEAYPMVKLVSQRSSEDLCIIRDTAREYGIEYVSTGG